MSSPVPLQDLLDVAMDAAYLGGRRTLAYFNAGVAVETKSDNTPVTQADKESEQIIRARIAKSFPGHAIIGEEQGETKGDAEVRWIIDPIDGTKSFIKGVPLYAVLIGVEVRGEASVGVMYFPPSGDMVAAATGLGCRWNGRPCGVSNVATLEEATLLTSSFTSCVQRSDAFDNLAARCKLVRGWGDAYGYFMVATGRAEIMLDPAMHPWDCAPMLPILREAGGRFATWRGDATIWGPDAFATNAALHAPVLDALRGEKLRAKG